MQSGSVLVTGGTGFLGRALVEGLLSAGGHVKALARSDASTDELGALGAEAVRGDVLDLESLVALMRGCDVVYHAAGANAFCLHDPSPMFEVNVRGAWVVCTEAASSKNRGRAVMTSNGMPSSNATQTPSR